MLSRAKYPEIWDRPGFPPLPVTATIFGNLVHRVVEQLGKKLSESGISSPQAGDVVAVLGSLGGWRGIVLAAIEDELSKLGGNPRASTVRVDRVRDELERLAPEAADQVKAFLGRGLLPKTQSSAKSAASANSRHQQVRTPAALGAHPEREVTAEELRLTGQIDLLVIDQSDVAVTDFKTGTDNNAHDEQVRLYALLWYLDSETNPDARLATKLKVAYPSYERTVEAPDNSQLDALRRETSARIEAADAIAGNPPPQAIPSEESCRYCPVKPICHTYWKSLPHPTAPMNNEEWLDFEGRAIRPNGSRSWFFESTVDSPVEVLVRTFETDVAFPSGQKVRILGARGSQDPDVPERPVISMTSTSEWYPVRAS